MDEYVYVDRESFRLWTALDINPKCTVYFITEFCSYQPSIKFVHIYFQLIWNPTPNRVPTIVRGG